jgi:hypothetical protein
MRHFGNVCALSVFCLSLSLGAQCRAGGLTLDQSHVVPGSGADYAVVTTQSLAQTFTVGLSGLLAEIDLQISKNTGATGDLAFTIRTTSGGLPNTDDGQSLFTTVIPLSSIPTVDSPFDTVSVTAIDVSSATIMVTPGEVLALGLSRTGAGVPPWATWRSSTDNYSGGALYQRSGPTSSWDPVLITTVGQDAGFQTYISTVPEPSSLVLAGISTLVGLGLRTWKRG